MYFLPSIYTEARAILFITYVGLCRFSAQNPPRVPISLRVKDIILQNLASPLPICLHHLISILSSNHTGRPPCISLTMLSTNPDSGPLFFCSPAWNAILFISTWFIPSPPLGVRKCLTQQLTTVQIYPFPLNFLSPFPEFSPYTTTWCTIYFNPSPPQVNCKLQRIRIFFTSVLFTLVLPVSGIW